jgi:hypothetical protein
MRLFILVTAALGFAFMPFSAMLASAKQFAPGQRQVLPGQAKNYAPGQRQIYPGQAEQFAPGHLAR